MAFYFFADVEGQSGAISIYRKNLNISHSPPPDFLGLYIFFSSLSLRMSVCVDLSNYHPDSFIFSVVVVFFNGPK